MDFNECRTDVYVWIMLVQVANFVQGQIHCISILAYFLVYDHVFDRTQKSLKL